MLLDQEVELDLPKRRYTDKIRDYEFISVDLKRREDRYFADLDYVHILTEGAEVFRIHNEATECVLREEWNDVEDAWMPDWRHQNRLIKGAQLCQCTCVCGNRDGVESWNDDEIPTLLLGEERRDTERAGRAQAIVDEEMKKRRDEGRNRGRRLRCARDCECPKCAHEEVEVSTSVGVDANKAWTRAHKSLFLRKRNCRAQHGLPDQDRLHRLALELPMASCPQGQGAWLNSSVPRSRRLLIWWWWAAVSPSEGEVDLQHVNNVINEEGEFQRQPEEETEYHEEPFFEGRSREWEERST